MLVNFPNMPNEELKKQCDTLSKAMSCSGQSGLNGQELALELQTFPDLPKRKMTFIELLSFLQEKTLKEVFPYMWVAQRIAVMIPVTVAMAEKSFSK